MAANSRSVNQEFGCSDSRALAPSAAFGVSSIDRAWLSSVYRPGTGYHHAAADVGPFTVRDSVPINFRMDSAGTNDADLVPPRPRPGWHRDPWPPHRQWRWWDGYRWNGYVVPVASFPARPGPPETISSEPGQTDLLLRFPGQGAEEKARQLRAEAPMRTTLARVLGVHSEERAWRIGAKGEAWVGRELAGLPDSWRAFHDLPVGPYGANLDHLVVGPGGVFSLNTKNLSSNVWLGDRALLVNGTKTDYLAKSLREARRVGAHLGHASGRFVTVVPVLVLLCNRLTRKGCPVDVVVLEGRELRRWLVARSPALGDDEIKLLGGLACAAATWAH
jgi:hypothetical protein